ncbi:MAG: DNA cytosine methyltransferase [Galactobacter sp.]
MTTSLTSPSDETSDSTDAISIIDLFAGVGGLSEGFHQASSRYQVLKAVEMEPRAAAGYRLNHGGDVFAGTIQDWLATTKVPDADLVIGGPPCQGFSTLGKQSADDVRNELWRAYAEVVRKARPRYFVLENVPQFLTSNQFPLFRLMTEPGGELEDYTITPHLVNAAEYGAAQIRRRVIVVGHREDVADPGFPEPNKDRSTWRTVRQAIGRLSKFPKVLPERVTLVEGKRTPGPFRATELHVGRDYSDLSKKRFAAIPEGGNRNNLPDDLKCEAWRRHTSGSGDVMGRLHWNQPSVTIRTEFIKPEKGRYIHPVANRAITPREGARLQGFPDGYRFVGPVTEIVKQIGNAVPIPLGKAIGEHLIEYFP